MSLSPLRAAIGVRAERMSEAAHGVTRPVTNRERVGNASDATGTLHPRPDPGPFSWSPNPHREPYRSPVFNPPDS